MSSFKGRNIISLRDMTTPDLWKIVTTAEEVKSGKHRGCLLDKTIASLFFEPSTRTRLSFESAVVKSGGSVFGFADPGSSSQKKGESFSDSIRTVTGYCDAMVIRHPVEGAARLASEVASVPVINAGDGANQHPTQTFLDLFTIYEEFGRLENLKIGIMGDLKYGRTVHSLTHAMSLFGAEMVFISPPSLEMPSTILSDLSDKGVHFRTAKTPEDAADMNLDILYVTRIQKERFGDPLEYKNVAHGYRIDRNTIASLGEQVRIMHPLPRIDEIAEEVDNTPNAIYFTQAHNGVPTRQALLGLVTGGIN
ncbi:MAG: aspartate carbamoyltransferase [Candidatus Fermentibacteraceae bacterium]|nr:aspartate carbamoyltransferase [Candidatus Fermentibacteraceae bacterium]